MHPWIATLCYRSVQIEELRVKRDENSLLRAARQMAKRSIRGWKGYRAWPLECPGFLLPRQKAADSRGALRQELLLPAIFTYRTGPNCSPVCMRVHGKRTSRDSVHRLPSVACRMRGVVLNLHWSDWVENTKNVNSLFSETFENTHKESTQKRIHCGTGLP